MHPSPHPLDAALALTPQGPNHWLARVDASYQNMVGPFGGMLAALMLKPVLSDERRIGEPVSQTINFCAPIAEGDVQIDATPVRAGRSTQHWTLSVRQGGEVALTGSVMTATRRETWSADEHPMPEVPPPQSLGPRVIAPGFPAWLRRYDWREVSGLIPAVWDGAQRGDSTTATWVRDEPPRPLDFCSLAALCDIFYPRIWARRAERVPAGTVTMTSYFHTSGVELAALGTSHLLGQCVGQVFRNGYFDQTAKLWGVGPEGQGRLVATTHQLVYYKS
jgi:hypothetical protein